jgi:hypothetical protein
MPVGLKTRLKSKLHSGAFIYRPLPMINALAIYLLKQPGNLLQKTLF